MISVLVHDAYGFTTTRLAPTNATRPKAPVLSNSKTQGGRPTSGNKEDAVEAAEANGTVKSSALADRLLAQNIAVALPAVRRLTLSDLAL